MRLLRFGLFAAYITFFFSLPFGLLWGLPGAGVGLLLSIAFFFQMGYHGRARITESLKASPVHRAQAPHLHATLDELARRLSLAPPRLYLLDSPAVNIALFGFSRHRATLVLTSGATQQLNREALLALMAREMTELWKGELINSTWLARFLGMLEPWLSPPQTDLGKRYSFKLVLRQILLYPLTFVPTALLRAGTPAEILDLRAAKLSRHPRDLAEAYRLLEAYRDRTRLLVPYSTRPLFLVSPPTLDPFVRAFLGSTFLTDRIKKIEKMTSIVVPD